MRRVRRFFVTLCVLALFAAAVPVSAAERNPYQPVRTEMFTSGESEAIHSAGQGRNQKGRHTPC